MTSTTQTVHGLVEALAEREFYVDAVSDLAAARKSFFERGGHDLLLLAHDVSPALARRVLRSLRSVDDHLPVVVFGEELARGYERPPFTRLPSYHPSSRAGIGAVLKILQTSI